MVTIFFSMNSQNIFFSCLIYCLKVEAPSEYQKKAQNGLPGAPKATLLVLLHVVRATECDKKGGMPGTELLNTFIDRAFNIFYKFGVKVKV